MIGLYEALLFGVMDAIDGKPCGPGLVRQVYEYRYRLGFGCTCFVMCPGLSDDDESDDFLFTKIGQLNEESKNGTGIECITNLRFNIFCLMVCLGVSRDEIRHLVFAKFQVSMGWLGFAGLALQTAPSGVSDLRLHSAMQLHTMYY